MDHGFYGEFLGELEALDAFLMRRRGAERFIQPEDPDIRRLMESLAFFAARTHTAAQTELRRAIDRLTRGLLDEFTLPQPARGLLRGMPSPRLAEPAHVPRGSRIRLETAEGDVGFFSTMRDVTIRPLELDRAELQLLGGSGHRVLLRLRSRVPVPGVSEPLRLQVDHLGDYEVSRQFFEWLRLHLDRVAVVYGDPPPTSERGAECKFRLGAPGDVDEAGPPRESGSAVARIREFFHFPAKDLTLDIELARPTRPWRQAWLCLDFGEWPEGQVVHPEMFRLFVVPIENLFGELAEPIKADGTRTRHRIRPWRIDHAIAFHSIVEVQQEGAGGLDPLLPSQLAGGAESYELDVAADPNAADLLLRIPDALMRPRSVLVRARWFQPAFDAVAVGALEASLQHRHFEGVGFRVLGRLTPHRRSTLWGDPAAMLHVLSRRAKRVLNRSDIVMLMAALGADAHSYHDVAGDILHVDVRDEPVGRRGGVQHTYDVMLGAVAAERRGLLVDYLRCAGMLIDAWSNNPAEIRTQEAGARRRGERTGAGR